MMRPGRCAACRRRYLVPLLLALHGCTTGWRAEQVAPAELIRQRGPTEVQVKRTDGSYLYLRDPAVVADSIVGWEARSGPRVPG